MAFLFVIAKLVCMNQSGMKRHLVLLQTACTCRPATQYRYNFPVLGFTAQKLPTFSAKQPFSPCYWLALASSTLQVVKFSLVHSLSKIIDFSVVQALL